jgi:hypothetical protein
MDIYVRKRTNSVLKVKELESICSPAQKKPVSDQCIDHLSVVNAWIEEVWFVVLRVLLVDPLTRTFPGNPGRGRTQ